jgi:hypothetical protein
MRHLRAHLQDHATVDAPTINMQSRTHLQETCDWSSTYMGHAIGIAPTNNMQLELYLQERWDWDRTCNKQ